MQKYSIFLTPSGVDLTHTANLIWELCGKYGGHPFEPHVTVLSGEYSDLDALREAVTAAVTGIMPFSLRVRGVGCGEAYFRCLFLEFEENPVLRELHERLRAAVNPESGQVFFPHLSLLYSDMPLRHKEALVKRVIPDRTEIHFDKVKIVTPRNLKEGWRDTGQWQTLFRAGLGEERDPV
jgi:putative hydrolase of the HAD superfamily